MPGFPVLLALEFAQMTHSQNSPHVGDGPAEPRELPD